MKASVAWRQERYEPGAVDGVTVHASHDFAAGERCTDCGCTRGMRIAERKCFLGAQRRDNEARDAKRRRARGSGR